MVDHGFELADVSEHVDDDCIVWVDVFDPSPDQLQLLGEELHLHATALEDAATVHERPKAMRYDSHLFVGTFAIHVDADDGDYRLSRISAFVLPHAIVTVRLDDGFDIDELQQRWKENSDLIKYGTKALLHGLLDMVVDGYFTEIEKMDDIVEDLAASLFEDDAHATGDIHRRTFEVRRNVSKIRRVILPMRDVVNVVMRRVVEYEHDAPLVPYYQDLYDHILRAAEWTDDLRDTITSIHETNLSLADNRMNQIMKKLTGWAAIIAVPTAITGWFGQNVPYPGFSKEWGFYLSVISIVAVAAMLYLVFKRRDWL